MRLVHGIHTRLFIADKRVLVTRSDGSQPVVEIKEDLGLKANDKAGMMARLKAPGVDAASVDSKGGVEEEMRAATLSLYVKNKEYLYVILLYLYTILL